MTNNSYKTPPKSAGQRLKEDLIYMAIGGIIVTAFNKLLEFIMKPLRAPTLDEDGFNERREKTAEEKEEARAKYYEEIETDESDPMHQFQLRFLSNVEDYKARKEASENKKYKEWYYAWKRGEILDPGLRWAPEITKNGKFNPAFVNYMKIQYTLHKSASFIQKRLFYRTLDKYFPELTPNPRGLAHDLSALDSMLEERRLENDLKDAIKKYGLRKELADYLVNADPNKIKEQAETLKVFQDNKFDPKTCICALENNIDVEGARVIDKVVVDFCLPTKVGLAYLRKQIDENDIMELVSMVNFQIASCGDEVLDCREGSNATYLDEVLDGSLLRCKAKNRLAKFR
jgi:hypothetical protein